MVLFLTEASSALPVNPESLGKLLQFGLPGLIVALLFMAFVLIFSNQRPGKNATRLIAGFLFTSMISAGGILYGQLSKKSAGEKPISVPTSPFVLDYSIYLVDLNNRQPLPERTSEESSKVLVMRSDMIRKTSEDGQYELDVWTMGSKIDHQSIVAPFPGAVSFSDLGLRSVEGKNRRCYHLRLATNNHASGSVIPMTNQFTFYNGFPDDTKEDWRASIMYPTRFVSITLLLPAGKPITKPQNVKITLISKENSANSREITTENPASVSPDGRAISWAGLNLPEKNEVKIEWEW